MMDERNEMIEQWIDKHGGADSAFDHVEMPVIKSAMEDVDEGFIM